MQIKKTVRTGHGTMDWFQIGKGVRQGCRRLILSVLGTLTLGIIFGGSSGILLTGKNNSLPVEGVSSLGGKLSEHRC